MKIIKIIIIMSFVFLLTGCFSYKEINDLAIVNAIGISKENDMFKITIQILNTKKPASVGGAENDSGDTTIFTGKGKTILEAIDKTSLKSPKTLYLSHLDLVIVDEEIAKKGLLEIIDFLARDNISSKEFNILITKDSPEDVLKIITPLEISVSTNIYKSITTSEENIGYTKQTRYDKLLKMILEKGINPSIGGIKVKGDLKEGMDEDNLSTSKASSDVILDGIAIFKSDKLVGWLNNKESSTFNFITNNIKKTVINIPCNDNYIGIKVLDSNSNIRPNLNNNNLTITINIDIKASVNELNCNINLNKKELVKLEKKINNSLKKDINDLLDILKMEYKTDIIGFGNKVYKKYPTYFKKNKDKWDEEIFHNLKINIEIKTKLIDKGNIKSFKGGK